MAHCLAPKHDMEHPQGSGFFDWADRMNSGESRAGLLETSDVKMTMTIIDSNRKVIRFIATSGFVIRQGWNI